MVGNSGMNRRSFFRSTAAIIVAAAVPVDLMVRPTLDDVIRDILIREMEALQHHQPLFPQLIRIAGDMAAAQNPPAGEVIEMIIKPYVDEPMEENRG